MYPKFVSLIWAFLILTIPMTAHAQTFLQFKTDLNPISSQTNAQALKLGKWKWDESKGLRLDPQTEEKNSFWVSPTRTHQEGDATRGSVIRAEFTVGKRLDSSIFFRSSFPDNLAEVNGYSVSFNHQKVQFHRWEGGYAAPITDPIKLKEMPKKIRVYIFMWGFNTLVEIENPENHTLLAKLNMTDLTFRGTQIGYRAHKKQDANTALTALDWIEDENLYYRRKFTHPDAYIRQHPASYVFAPQNDKKEPLNRCKKLNHTYTQGYDIYRCSNEQMQELADKKQMLPKGYFWAEPRISFTDEEFRKASKDLDCTIPMHCNPNAPIAPNRAAKDVDMIQALLDAYVPVCQKKIKNVRLETIGQTYLGYPIRAIVLTNTETKAPKPRVLFNGAHHGMELLSTDMAFDVLEQLCESNDESKRAMYDDALSKLELWIIPAVNLDGNDLYIHVSSHLGRKNGRDVFIHDSHAPYPKKPGPYNENAAYYRYHPNDIAVGAGVDINRNYPLHWGATGEKSSSGRPRDYWYRGPAPASEPEIQSMMNLFHKEQFVSSISFHTVSTRILSPYSIDALKNPPHDEDQAWQLALRMAESAGRQASGKPYKVVKNLYSVDGTDQDWFRMVSGTYAYLIEGPLHNPTGKKRTNALIKSRPAWETFLDASRSATIVRVRDKEGNPLIAEVSYSDVPQLNGEHWMTRCEDGTHTMLCFGDRTVTVKLSNGMTETKTTKCNSSPSVLDFTFEHPDISKIDAYCASGYCDSLTSVDTICSLKNNTCPTLPANRFCLIEGRCVPNGTKASFGVLGSYLCDPIKNNRGWTK